MTRLVPPAVMLVIALLAAFAATAGAQSASLPDIEDEVMCPICGTTLELSEAPQADRERELIRRLIAEGRDKEEIKDALVAEYGPDVLAEPDDSGFDLAAWLVPVGGLAVVALVGAALVLRRRRRPPASAEGPLEAADAARLTEDMRRYDL